MHEIEKEKRKVKEWKKKRRNMGFKREQQKELHIYLGWSTIKTLVKNMLVPLISAATHNTDKNAALLWHTIM